MKRLLALALFSLAACHKPPCRGELSDADVTTWKAKVQRGEPACEELTQAKIEIVTDGVTLNGELIGFHFRGEQKDAIPHVSQILGQGRESWLRIHPGTQFDGTIDITVPKERPAGQGASLTSIAAAEGFRHATIHAGDLTLTADLWPGPAKVAATVAHVEQQNAAEYHLRFSGPGAPSARRIVSPDVADLSTQLAKEWTGVDPTPRALVVRSTIGTFADALKLAKELVALPALSHAMVAFEVGRPQN